MAKSKFLRSVAVGLAALATVSTVAFAAGYFPYFPVVGGASYCSSVSGTGTSTGTPSFPTGPGASFGQGAAGTAGQFGAVCNDTVPAGPVATTGNEFIPMDTGLPSGQQPQTALLSTRLIGAGGTQYQTPLTAASLTVLANETSMLLEPAGTIATLTILLPAAAGLIEGQTWRVSSTQTVTALTLTPGSGTTIINNPTAITVSNTAPYGYEFQYKASTAKWYRLQ